MRNSRQKPAQHRKSNPDPIPANESILSLPITYQPVGFLPNQPPAITDKSSLNSSAVSTVTVPSPSSTLSGRPAVQVARNSHDRQDELDESAGAVSPKKRNFKRLILSASIFLAGICLAKVAYTWWTVGRFIESTDDAYVGGDVTVIAPKVAGFISKLFVGDNQQVHAGDMLLKLDDRDYLAALAKADASVAIQQAALSNLDAMRHLQEAIIAQAQATIAAAEAEIVRSRDDQVRFSRLLKDSAVRSEEHTSELQSHLNLVCRLLLEKKKHNNYKTRQQLPTT